MITSQESIHSEYSPWHVGWSICSESSHSSRPLTGLGNLGLSETGRHDACRQLFRLSVVLPYQSNL